DGILERLETVGRQADRVVVELADVAIQGLRDLDALTCARRLRRAAQRVTGAMQVFRDDIRRRGQLACGDVLTNDREMAGGFFAVDGVQRPIQRRRERFLLPARWLEQAPPRRRVRAAPLPPAVRR